jgi:hypothetical protein
MDDFVLCRRKLYGNYSNIRTKDFRDRTKSEWTKNHNQKENAKLQPSAAQQNPQNNLPGDCEGGRGEWEKERERETIEILRFLTVLGTHVFREVNLCRWSISSRRFEGSYYLYLFIVKKSTHNPWRWRQYNPSERWNTTNPTINRHVPEDTNPPALFF